MMLTWLLLSVLHLPPDVHEDDRLTFPVDYHEAKRQYDLYAAYTAVLDRRKVDLPYWGHPAIDQWIAESKRAEQAWLLLYQAKWGYDTPPPWPAYCRSCLRGLRDVLGFEAYYSGRMPAAWPPGYDHPEPERPTTPAMPRAAN